MNTNNEEVKKGTCKQHGPYIWKWVNGVCITEHIKKREEPFTTPTTTKKNSRLVKDYSLSELYGALDQELSSEFEKHPINVSQRDVDKQLARVEGTSIHRQNELQEEEKFKQKQNSYRRVLELRRILREAESQFQELYREKPKEETKVKKRKEYALVSGEWVELE